MLIAIGNRLARNAVSYNDKKSGTERHPHACLCLCLIGRFISRDPSESNQKIECHRWKKYLTFTFGHQHLLSHNSVTHGVDITSNMAKSHCRWLKLQMCA